MKLELKDLVKDKCYICDIKGSKTKLYFKYSHNDNTIIFCKYSFRTTHKGYVTFVEGGNICIGLYDEKYISSTEVLFKEIVNHLPYKHKHKDRIVFVRNYKINYLLNI